MMRLDVWLVKYNCFPSRNAAKRAIHAGLVLVNGKQAKPALRISNADHIEIVTPFANAPLGYWKLKQIESTLKFSLFSANSFALDIGCSAGGFLRFLLEKGGYVVGIELSLEFFNKLYSLVQHYPNLSILFCDAFHLDPLVITKNKTLDLLLIDVTTKPSGTLKLIERYSQLLCLNGILLAAFKTRTEKNNIDYIIQKVKKIGFEAEPIVLSTGRKEFHIVGKRIDIC